MKINPLAVFQEEFDKSAVLFRADNGESFMLNETAAFLWKAFAGGKSEDEALAALREACNGELPSEAELELREFLTQLKRCGYLAD